MLSETSTVSKFMSKKLVSALTHSNVSRAVKLMVDYNIGSIIVSDKDGPIGIFTERDLLKKVLAAGKQLEQVQLMEVMTPSFNPINENATLVDAAKIMTEEKGRLIVFNNSIPIGIVTATDIVREIPNYGRRFDFSETFSKGVYQVPPRSKAEDVVRLMAEKGIGSVIVSEGQFSRGIFTERDLLRSALSPEFRMDEKIEKFSTHHLVTASEGISGLEACEIMTAKRMKRLPLTRGQDFVSGIVTARDLVQAFGDTFS
jgi:CBS domain-containing protein